MTTTIETTNGVRYHNPIFYGGNGQWYLDCENQTLVIHYRNGEPQNKTLVKKAKKMMRDNGIDLTINELLDRTKTSFPPSYNGLHKAVIFDIEINSIPDGLNLASGILLKIPKS